MKNWRMKRRFKKQWGMKTTPVGNGVYPIVSKTPDGWNVCNFPGEFDQEIWEYAIEKGWVRPGLFGRVRKTTSSPRWMK